MSVAAKVWSTAATKPTWRGARCKDVTLYANVDGYVTAAWQEQYGTGWTDHMMQVAPEHLGDLLRVVSEAVDAYAAKVAES